MASDQLPTDRDELAELIATIAVQVVAGFVDPKAMIPALRAWQATFDEPMTPVLLIDPETMQ